MALEESTRTSGLKSGVVLRVFVSLCILLSSLVQASLVQNVSIRSGQSGPDTVMSTNRNNSFDETEEIDYGQVLRDVVAAGLSKVPRSLVSKLLAADVRFECSTALLRTMKALQNLEPWALRRKLCIPCFVEPKKDSRNECATIKKENIVKVSVC